MFCILALGATLCVAAPGPGPGRLLQPGPNLLPGGRGLVTVSPRAGYVGPPSPVYTPRYDWPLPPPPPSAAPLPAPATSAQAQAVPRTPAVRRQRPPLPGPFERDPNDIPDELKD